LHLSSVGVILVQANNAPSDTITVLSLEKWGVAQEFSSQTVT